MVLPGPVHVNGEAVTGDTVSDRGLGTSAGVIALVLSLVTIVIAWIVFRPLLGIGLLAAAVAVKRMPGVEYPVALQLQRLAVCLAADAFCAAGWPPS